MSITPFDHKESKSTPISPEVIYPPTDEGRVLFAYDKQNLDVLLRSYAFAEPHGEEANDIATQSEVDEAIAGYAATISPFAIAEGRPNIPLLRTATATLVDGMNRVASEKFGYKLPKSRWHWLLTQAGIESPETRSYFVGLDDRYWERQFPEEYSEERLVRRAQNESESDYLARHIHRAWHGLIFAPFSYIQDATHASVPTMRIILIGRSKR